MNEFIAELVAEYGRDMTMYSDENANGLELRACIEPLSEQAVDKLHVRTKAGGVKRAVFLLIAGMGSYPDGARNVRFVLDGLEYELLRADRYSLGGEFTHWEGILRLVGRERDYDA